MGIKSCETKGNIYDATTPRIMHIESFPLVKICTLASEKEL